MHHEKQPTAPAPSITTSTTSTQTFINITTNGYGSDKLSVKQRKQALGHEPLIKLPKNVMKKNDIGWDVGKMSSLRKKMVQRFQQQAGSTSLKRKIADDDDDDDFETPVMPSLSPIPTPLSPLPSTPVSRIPSYFTKGKTPVDFHYVPPTKMFSSVPQYPRNPRIPPASQETREATSCLIALQNLSD